MGRMGKFALACLLAAVAPVVAGNQPAQLVLTAKENGENQSEFMCTGKIHGYVVLPGRMTGKHRLEGIWTMPSGEIAERTRSEIDYAPPGKSTAYVWLAFDDGF